MLHAGARAPEFTLPDQDGNEVSLSGLLGGRPLILYFYPADFTPGCTREACTFRDLHADFERAGLMVAGVSPQTPKSHRSFRAKYALPFPLLSDCDKAVARMYEVCAPFGLGIRRATYLIDRARIVVDVVLADFRIARHEAFARAALAARRGTSTTP
ncbi:MAG TPA: peroxiredoxin [Steroidobacteraceae bacterium]|nr:peroxiredoxin [Steroidobacteraceae bacterium]